MTELIYVALMLVGATSIVFGIYLLMPPLAFIAAGAAVMSIAREVMHASG